MASGSGSFVGHALPAVFFIGYSCYFLLLTLKRCRDLQDKSRKNEGDDDFSLSLSFAARHLPEQNPAVLLGTGIFLVICTTVGSAYEGVLGMRASGYFHQLTHQVLYLSFFFTAVVYCLEANKRLFPNSHRYSLTLTFLLQYILWNEHAAMKKDMSSDMRVHLLQAHVNFVAFVTFGYSAYNTKSVFAYVSSWAVMTLNGVWLL